MTMTPSEPHIDRNALIVSLIAGIDSQPFGDRPNLLADEDFVLDLDGEWVKLEYGYANASSQKILIGAWYGCVLYGPRTSFHDEQDAKRRDAQADIDSKPHYRMITTYEQRLLRYATKRADEILSSRP
jgi:hypothetical protein